MKGMFRYKDAWG